MNVSIAMLFFGTKKELNLILPNGTTKSYTTIAAKEGR
jgi:hypothetical protein